MTKKLQSLTFTFLIILLTLPAISFPQQKLAPKSIELMNVKEILETTCFDKISWQVQNNERKYNPISARFVINDIDSYLLRWKPNNDSLGIELRSKKIFTLIKKYRNKFDSTFIDFRNSNTDKFVYFQDVALPIHFGLFNDTALSLLISGAVSDNVYNTLKLTLKQRAAKVITTYILPALKIVANNFTNKEIKYFGMSCAYGSKDFGDDDPNATKAEFVSFLAPSSLIRKYTSSDITEDELVNAAEIYISDRDMGIHEIKKIKIVLE
jgi:hypothetical protein